MRTLLLLCALLAGCESVVTYHFPDCEVGGELRQCDEGVGGGESGGSDGAAQ